MGGFFDEVDALAMADNDVDLMPLLDAVRSSQDVVADLLGAIEERYALLDAQLRDTQRRSAAPVGKRRETIRQRRALLRARREEVAALRLLLRAAILDQVGGHSG